MVLVRFSTPVNEGDRAVDHLFTDITIPASYLAKKLSYSVSQIRRPPVLQRVGSSPWVRHRALERGGDDNLLPLR